LWGNGGTPAQRSANWILEKGAVFFELAEQWNRRIAFRAALELASNNPDAKVVQEALTRYPDEFRVLTQVEGFTPSQARAIVTANHAVEQTQFVYARYARPRFMRGRLAGSLFVFKRYIQGLLFLGFNNPSFALRYVMIAMLMGGMGGVPFYEDLKGLVEGILRYFGQNANAERLIRQWVADYFGDSPPVPADVILHGMARRGFGVPALLDHLGSYATGRPGRGLLSTMPGQNIAFPQLDRSKAITSGPIFPIEFKALLDPTADTNKTIAEQSQKAAGAIFSVGFNMYKFLMDNHLSISDPKRWERALPRELAAVSKTWRTYTEGRDRYGPKASGSTVINYDVRDTEQLMEVIALGLGYNNLRSTAKWDKVMDEREYDQYWQHQRNAIYEQYYEALKTGQEEEIAAARKALQKFNMDVAGTPARGYAISSEKLLQSMKARERARLGRESGIPVQKQNIPIAREIERLHPEAGNVIDVRRVR
jgi:hypothetical protein